MKITKHYRLWLVIWSIFACQSGVYASDKEYLAELNILYQEEKHNQLYQRLLFPQSQSETKDSLFWLRQQFKAGEGGARLAYVYAARLNGSGIKETAIFAYVVAMLTARMDAARCVDLDAPLEKIVQWEKGLRHIEQAYAKLPLGEQNQLLSLAAKWEKKTRQRGKDMWLCSGGQAQFDAYYRKYGFDSEPPLKIITVPFSSDKSVIIDIKEIPPEFIGDSEWLSMQEEVRKKLRAELFNKRKQYLSGKKQSG